MPGKCRPSLRAKTLENVMRSNLSTTDKECIKAVFDLNDVLQRREVEPVVRCKDCKHNNAEKALRKGGIWCEYWGTDPDPDDFCKRGERRADDATD